MLRHLSVTCCIFAAFPLVTVGQETKKEGQELTLRSKLSEAKPDSCCNACTVNFRKELGVPLNYLDSIGHRIHQARKAPDPVDLALAAQALAIAEKVAGKKAPIGSKEVMKEAIELAKMRGISSELAALSEIVSDKAAEKEIDKQLALAVKREKEAKAQVEEGAEPRDIHGTLQVVNHTGECLRIFVDGRYVGTVHEGRVARFHVHAHGYENHLDAYCEEGGELVRHTHVYGHRHFVNWHIDP